MMGKYEAEQKVLLEQVNALRKGIAQTKEQRDNTARFVEYILSMNAKRSPDNRKHGIARSLANISESPGDTGSKTRKYPVFLQAT